MTTEKKTTPKYDGADGSVPVFVLIPWEAKEKDATLELLPDVFASFAVEPSVHFELKAAVLPPASILYVAHTTKARKQRPDGTYGDVRDLHFSKPLKLADYQVRGTDGYTFATDFEKLVDSITAACKQPQKSGNVIICTISADKEPHNRLVKLSTT